MNATTELNKTESYIVKEVLGAAPTSMQTLSYPYEHSLSANEVANLSNRYTSRVDNAFLWLECIMRHVMRDDVKIEELQLDNGAYPKFRELMELLKQRNDTAIKLIESKHKQLIDLAEETAVDIPRLVVQNPTIFTYLIRSPETLGFITALEKLDELMKTARALSFKGLLPPSASHAICVEIEKPLSDNAKIVIKANAYAQNLIKRRKEAHAKKQQERNDAKSIVNFEKRPNKQAIAQKRARV